MTRAETLEALAQRCEGEIGGRDLDNYIFYILGLFPARDGPLSTYLAPRYTTSLDAAMPLVPEGLEGLPLSFKVERFYLGNGITVCRATLWDGLGGVCFLDTASQAPTPALALTAACLRAHAAIGEGK